MTWCVEGETPPKKANWVRSAGQILATVFWDAEEVLLVQYHPKGETVTQHTYKETLKKLPQAIRRKRPNLHDGDILFIHNNTCPHTTAKIRELLSHFGREIFAHPAYSPDLAPSDFFLFLELKKFLGGKQFTTDAEGIWAVNSFFQSHGTEFYRWGLDAIIKRYSKCSDIGGSYAEK